MRDAGINRVAIGFESPIAEELEAMNKRLRPEEMIELTRCYHRAGFSVHGMFIFGYPMREGQKVHMGADERVKRFKQFIRQARIDTLQVLLPVPLPGTELRNRLQEENRVYSTDIVGWEYYDGNFPLFEPDEPMTAEDMHRAVRSIMGSFYRGTRLLNVAANLLTFPSLIFHLGNMRAGWRRWRKKWLNNVVKFGGWRIMRKWREEFRKDDFGVKLSRARQEL
jgi:radical SAM superfamily enzyme YgiQ (UPF0313 family)